MNASTRPSEVEIREVGPRDGLQSLADLVPTDTKIELVRRLATTGLRRIEVGSFVSPRAVPQMADSAEVVARSRNGTGGPRFESLVVNLAGAQRAITSGVDGIVVVVAASDTFSQRNVRMTTDEALHETREIVSFVKARSLPVVADVATSFGCAFEGKVDEGRVRQVAHALADLGIAEIVLADTTGMGSPQAVRRLCRGLIGDLGDDVRLGLHLHDTRGLGLANAYAGLEEGVRLLDSSVGGLGGCPFSPGATGNIATEDLVHFLHLEGQDTGLDIDALIETAWFAQQALDISLPGSVMRGGPSWRPRLTVKG